MADMKLELTEKERTGVDEVTHLLETVSVEECQGLLDEHLTSVQMMQASAFCKG
jgi:hypothetical protein